MKFDGNIQVRNSKLRRLQGRLTILENLGNSYFDTFGLGPTSALPEK